MKALDRLKMLQKGGLVNYGNPSTIQAQRYFGTKEEEAKVDAASNTYVKPKSKLGKSLEDAYQARLAEAQSGDFTNIKNDKGILTFTHLGKSYRLGEAVKGDATSVDAEDDESKVEVKDGSIPVTGLPSKGGVDIDVKVSTGSMDLKSKATGNVISPSAADLLGLDKKGYVPVGGQSNATGMANTGVKVTDPVTDLIAKNRAILKAEYGVTDAYIDAIGFEKDGSFRKGSMSTYKPQGKDEGLTSTNNPKNTRNSYGYPEYTEGLTPEQAKETSIALLMEEYKMTREQVEKGIIFDERGHIYKTVGNDGAEHGLTIAQLGQLDQNYIERRLQTIHDVWDKYPDLYKTSEDVIKKGFNPTGGPLNDSLNSYGPSNSNTKTDNQIKAEIEKEVASMRKGIKSGTLEEALGSKIPVTGKGTAMDVDKDLTDHIYSLQKSRLPGGSNAWKDKPDILNRSDPHRDKPQDEEIIYLLDYMKSQGIPYSGVDIVDIGSGLGIEPKKGKADMPGETVAGLYDRLYKSGTDAPYIYATDYEGSYKDFKGDFAKKLTGSRPNLKTALFDGYTPDFSFIRQGTEPLILKAANSVDKIFDEKEAVAHFKDIASKTVNKPVFYIYHDKIMFKAANSSSWKYLGDIENKSGLKGSGTYEHLINYKKSKKPVYDIKLNKRGGSMGKSILSGYIANKQQGGTITQSEQPSKEEQDEFKLWIGDMVQAGHIKDTDINEGTIPQLFESYRSMKKKGKWKRKANVGLPTMKRGGTLSALMPYGRMHRFAHKSEELVKSRYGVDVTPKGIPVLSKDCDSGTCKYRQVAEIEGKEVIFDKPLVDKVMGLKSNLTAAGEVIFKALRDI